MSDPSVSQLRQIVGPHADVTLNIGCIGLVPTSPQFARPIRLQWAGLDEKPDDAELWESDGQLVLQLYGHRPLKKLSSAWALRIANEEAVIGLSDGSEVTCKFADAVATGSVFRRDGTHTAGLRFELPAWVWNEKNLRALPLAAQVREFPKIGEGNLTLCTDARSSAGHFRGQGHFPWHVLREGFAVVDATSSDHSDLVVSLERDLQALEFAFGTELNPGPFFAIDSHGSVVGGVGLGWSSSSCYRTRCPTPTAREVNHCWAAPLFRRVAEHGAVVDKLTIAMAGYMDGLRGHIHSNYLLGQIALEAFCRDYVPKSAAASLVASPEDWQNWLASHTEAITSFARDTDSAQMLLNKMKHNVIQRPTGELVARAFEEWNSPLPAELLKELGLRGKAAHRYVMFDEAKEDIQDAADRVDKVQCMLAAAISKAVGYTGPIAGWERDGMGRLKQPAFWKTEPQPEAQQQFYCGNSDWI